MIPVLKNRLEEIINKYSEIESKLLDNDMNMDIRLNLSKEHSDLVPIVLAINELKSCEEEIDGVREILNDKDTDSSLREEALKELDNLKKSLESLILEYFINLLLSLLETYQLNPKKGSSIISKLKSYIRISKVINKFNS